MKTAFNGGGGRAFNGGGSVSTATAVGATDRR